MSCKQHNAASFELRFHSTPLLALPVKKWKEKINDLVSESLNSSLLFKKIHSESKTNKTPPI